MREGWVDGLLIAGGVVVGAYALASFLAYLAVRHKFSGRIKPDTGREMLRRLQ